MADHETAFHSGIHAEGELLPWHRNFILMLENILRKVDCRVTVPFVHKPTGPTVRLTQILFAGTTRGS